MGNILGIFHRRPVLLMLEGLMRKLNMGIPASIHHPRVMLKLLIPLTLLFVLPTPSSMIVDLPESATPHPRLWSCHPRERTPAQSIIQARLHRRGWVLALLLKTSRGRRSKELLCYRPQPVQLHAGSQNDLCRLRLEPPRSPPQRPPQQRPPQQRVLPSRRCLPPVHPASFTPWSAATHVQQLLLSRKCLWGSWSHRTNCRAPATPSRSARSCVCPNANHTSCNPGISVSR